MLVVRGPGAMVHQGLWTVGHGTYSVDHDSWTMNLVPGGLRVSQGNGEVWQESKAKGKWQTCQFLQILLISSGARARASENYQGPGLKPTQGLADSGKLNSPRAKGHQKQSQSSRKNIVSFTRFNPFWAVAAIFLAAGQLWEVTQDFSRQPGSHMPRPRCTSLCWKAKTALISPLAVACCAAEPVGGMLLAACVLHNPTQQQGKRAK